MAKQTQVEKFKQAARGLGADDSEKRFNDRLTKIAKQKPKPEPRKATRQK